MGRGRVFPIILSIIFIVIIIYFFANVNQPYVVCSKTKTNDLGFTITEEIKTTLDGNSIEKMDIMLVSQNFKGVDDILKELFAENNKPFFDVLLRKTHLLQYYYGRVIQRFKNSNVSTFLYCNYVVARIYENLGDWNRSLEMVMDVIFIKNSSHNLYFEYLIELLKKYKKIHVSHDEIDFFKSANFQLQNKLQQKDQIIQTKNQELETKTGPNGVL